MRFRKLSGFGSAVWVFMNYTLDSGSQKGCFLRISANRMTFCICLPLGYRFADAKASTKPLLSGEYAVIAVNEPLYDRICVWLLFVNKTTDSPTIAGFDKQKSSLPSALSARKTALFMRQLLDENGLPSLENSESSDSESLRFCLRNWCGVTPQRFLKSRKNGRLLLYPHCL